LVVEIDLKCPSLLKLARCASSAMLLGLGLPATTSAVAGESWSPGLERSAIAFRMKMPAGAHIRQQYLYQEILRELLWLNTRQVPGMKPCAWKMFPQGEFGVFSVQVGHPNPDRRMSCLRAAVHLFLLQAIGEPDFLLARKREAETVARWRKPNPRIWPFDGFGLVHSALRTVYQRGSPLHQIYSIGSDDVDEVSFDEFELWLRRSRENRLIDFAGERKLLEGLGLSVPDPMVLRIVPSLESPRVPAGVHSFEAGERFGIPALILLKLYPDGLDEEIRRRLSCNTSGAAQLGEGGAGGAIAATLCDTYTMLNDEGWAFFFVTKVDGASYEDFCRQVQALTRDTDIATAVRFGQDGTKGLYILLPPQCGVRQ
jgi:hypothetical protein